MERIRFQQQTRKRKRQQDEMGYKKCWSDVTGNDCGIDKLPDDILINILSRTSLNESARASVLARRWRYLWRSAHETLRFDYMDTLTGNLMKRRKFDSWVNNVVELHQARYIEGLVIRLAEIRDKCPINCTTHDSWVYFAIQKEVRSFELYLPFNDFNETYRFPSVERLISLSQGESAPLCRLRTLRLANVDIEDEVVHYFLGPSCPNLEELCIHCSSLTENLQVIDPPSLRVLEISRCYYLNSLKIFAEGLVSLTYRGYRQVLLLEKIPNLRELSICDHLCMSFVLNPKSHWSYSVHLEKLVLDFRFLHSYRLDLLPVYLPKLCSLKRLEVFVVAGGTLLVFTPLIKASPQLREFRIERMSYSACSRTLFHGRIPFRGTKAGAMAMAFVHRNLKVVEIGGYRGCKGEEEMVIALMKIGPSIERVVIDTETDDFGLESYFSLQHEHGLGNNFCHRRTNTTRNRAKELAKHFATKIPRGIKFIVA